MTHCPAGLATHRDSMQGKAGNRLSNPIPAAYIEHMKKRMLMLAVLALAPNLGAKPNFVFFLVDDLGWADVACFGSTFHETPNIDALANTGMKFTDAYAACPVCSPTRASIMTGKYPARLNITDWIPGSSPKNRKLLGVEDLHQLPLEELCIAEALKAEGYATFFAGKWHLGNTGFFPEDQGFDVNIGGHHKGSPPGGYYSPWKNPKLENGKPGEYLTDRLGNETIKWISGQA
jgi:arylsulfatase A-like enzyme